ncbi:transglycosylase SLT domain-containing protein [Klebsiella aerogenes]|uniref:lytic transglycosylase domain-containing protein n=1 Tax=Klebsiella aerogenes TaxID=548 RepID=UPI002E331B85|nr:transglycosylase SLT domain-containing protein [Klebsiella aerogenes]MED7790277.1 transglycosylase SLT domain-containing protein [Klebsiella aerogenes]
MNAETIKDFLVSLGFKVDESGERKFNAVLAGVTSNAIKTGFAVEAAALSVVAFTAKIAQASDKLYWASQRTGATVQGLKQVSYAISQVGGSADSAMSSLESLSRFIRTNPGAEGFLNRLGVQTRDASGNMRDMASIFTGVGQKLSSMPYYRANQYASMLGIDENTLMAMRRGVGGFSGEYSAMAKAIGFNADQAAVSSNRFMTSLRSFGEMAGMARDKIGANLAGGLAGSLDKLRRQILDNFPKIERAITSVVKGILWAGDMLGRVISRLVQLGEGIGDWWKSLNKQTQEFIQLIGALTAAWWLLNRAMLASPITWILGLAAAIALLIEDYQTWKEGGKSLIDWGKWKPEVDAALKMVKDLRQTVVDLGKSIAKLLNIDPKSWSLKWDFSNFISQMGEFSKMLSMIGDLLNAIKEGRWSDVASIGKQLFKQGSDQPDALPGVTRSAESTRQWFIDKWNDVTQRFQDGGWYQHNQKTPQPTKAGAQLLGWMGPMLGKLEAMYNLPAGLLRSVAITESGGNQFAISGAGAKGLFQFMDGTARDMGLRGNDVFDPSKSAQAAAKYLSRLLQANGGDLSKALASYNWGLGNVQKYGMALMPQETRQYIPKVLSNMPSGGPAIHQETNINIHGVSDPRAAGREVADRQSGVNSRTLQEWQRGTG